MAARVFYSGDVDITCGGFFYRLDTWAHGYVNTVRVQPCSHAGGPDNVFWVEQLCVNIETAAPVLAFAGVGDTSEQRRAHRALHDIPTVEREEGALHVSGWSEHLADWDKLTVAQRRHAIVEAMVGYGAYEQGDVTMVSLGKPEVTRNKAGEWLPDKVLRANASLVKFAKGKL